MEAEDRNQRRQIPDQVEDVLKQHLFEYIIFANDRTVNFSQKQNFENNPDDVAGNEQAEEHIKLLFGAADNHIA
jgi:hypothetical protein